MPAEAISDDGCLHTDVGRENNVRLVKSPLTTYIIVTLRIRDVTPFCSVESLISYCKSGRIQSLQNATRCTKSVSNRAFLLHKSQLPILFLILQTLRSNIVVYLLKVFATELQHFKGSHLLKNDTLLHLHLAHATFLR